LILMQIKIMSFNIRYLNRHDGKNIWENRKELVIHIINKYNPDIIGFQEVKYPQYQFLTEKLDSYHHYGVGRKDGKHKGEHSLISYKKGFKCIESDTFWLSSTPNKPSKRWGGFLKNIIIHQHLPRIVSWCKLKTTENKEFYIYNTHFPLRKQARLHSIELIEKKIRPNKDKPLILLGDFNFDPFSKEYKQMTQILDDSYNNINEEEPIPPPTTFHGFTGAKIKSKSPEKVGRIDFIWINQKIKIKEIKIIMDNPSEDSQIYPTDHWPIFGIAEI